MFAADLLGPQERYAKGVLRTCDKALAATCLTLQWTFECRCPASVAVLGSGAELGIIRPLQRLENRASLGLSTRFAAAGHPPDLYVVARSAQRIELGGRLLFSRLADGLLL